MTRMDPNLRRGVPDLAARKEAARAYAETSVKADAATSIEAIARILNGGPPVRLGPGLGDPS